MRGKTFSEEFDTLEGPLPEVHESIEEQLLLDPGFSSETKRDVLGVLSRDDQQPNISLVHESNDEDSPSFETTSTRRLLKVWFDMPFAMWCESCIPNSLIEEGARFLAERQTLDDHDGKI